MTEKSLPDTTTLREKAERYLMPNYGTRDVVLVQGEGVRVRDSDGKEYLDFLGGIGVNNLGHCHPAVVGALKRQAEKLLHTSNAFLLQPQIELAERLCANLGMTKALFANSGAEVTEAAIKLARLWSRKKFGEDRHRIMVFKNSFHGRTFGALSATWSPKVREGFDPVLPGFVFAEFNDLMDVDEKWDDSICAVMMETVQGEGGVRPANSVFLRGLRQRCTEREAAMICDEVQCGMGRTGRRMAYQWAEVLPDIVPVAKALGGGVPIGALLARGEFADVFQKGSHGTTFGGNPLACAAALAATDILFEDGFLAEVGRKACCLWGLMESIIADFPEVCDHVRGVGLMQGLVLKVPALLLPAIARRHGLLVGVTAETVVRLLPPLIVSDEDLEEGAAKLRAALTEFRDHVMEKSRAQ